MWSGIIAIIKGVLLKVIELVMLRRLCLCYFSTKPVRSDLPAVHAGLRQSVSTANIGPRPKLRNDI